MVSEIIVKARAAQKLWENLPYSEKAKRLKEAARSLGQSVDEIARVIHEDNGKLTIDALATEVLPAILAMNFYIKNGRKFVRSRTIGGRSLLMFNKTSRMTFKPYGVVGIISPWNYPFAIPFSEVVMALLAGNAVILKTASVTPHVGRAIARIFEEAGLPDGLFAYVEMPGKDAGPAFIAGGIDKLFFTGSTATGRELMALAAPRLLPLVLELGGADAAIVRADADLDRAAAGVIWAGFSNAGQSCGGIQRVLVHRAVFAPFLEKLSRLTENLREGVDMGPMATLKQKQSVQRQIDACLAKGAKIAVKSQSSESGNFLSAIILTDVTDDMPVMREEIFGPVIAVMPVNDDEEALRIANSSAYGLTGSVWSRNRRAACALAARVNAGAMMVNDHLMSHGLAETPWGGFGDSGIGRTHGEAGFREMLKAQVVVDDFLPAVKRNLWWQPYSEKVYAGIHSIVELLAGRSFLSKMKALPGVLRIFFRYWEK
ncbi:MAG: aldehyde dehydrogenase family protein [Treponema sp.]|jgi:succinate-semialdehyde dehydrogenase/glutarate-semialdehyde dehydrogenase|nr:aldehyde dehydrogenase family protein [Treponema sp.]